MVHAVIPRFYGCAGCPKECSGFADPGDLRVAANGDWLCAACWSEQNDSHLHWSRAPIPPAWPADRGRRDFLRDVVCGFVTASWCLTPPAIGYLLLRLWRSWQ